MGVCYQTAGRQHGGVGCVSGGEGGGGAGEGREVKPFPSQSDSWGSVWNTTQ